ncbi:PAS domain S-box-containing protein/diguanylate cyclase (GGDEF)-like protein [Labedaea rhizosphaerae]|uniref:PAS domain S-box-containing protein/diguanylate cyclase (GGDEF)-like protein n=2 Tax=Labedaea rhizosphaerae TaxID=598644 RepID=A0A4R6S3W8_LABRH|nr:PAS domain S-box-containing protein/diguanylate cyclase (GGDEF)-like protein [Labedaea rhizosphaerae]
MAERVVRVRGTVDTDRSARMPAESRLARPESAMPLDAERIAQLGSWRLDPRTGDAFLSGGLRELAGLDATAGMDDLLRRVHRDDRSALKAFSAKLRMATDDEILEVAVRDCSGTRAYQVRGRATVDDEGVPRLLHGTVQDVTDRHLMERQFDQDRRLFSDAQRVARLGTWEWHIDTGECIWSTTLYDIFGVAPGTPVTYESYLQMVHPDDVGWVQERWDEGGRTGQRVECENRVIRPDGTVRVCLCRGEPLAEGAGIVIGTVQDVTEQRSIQDRMQRSSQRFTDLLAVAPVGIGLFDDDNRLVDANDALCSLLGRQLEAVRGLPAAELLHAEDQAGEDAPDRHGPLVAGLRVLASASGKPVYCELSSTESVADDGRKFRLVVFSDVTERLRVAQQLRYQATHDDLTGLPGRTAVNELLRELLSGEHAERVALLFCDVDNFKRVNDSMGHDAGDELIVALARRLERGLPVGCTVGRMSGDEYVVICADIDRAGGVETLTRSVSSLLKAAVPVRGQLLRVSASIGVAVPDGPDTTGADLLRFADAAMFEAKAKGAGRVALANPKMIASANSQMYLEGQLREAIANDGLVLHYQPVVGPDGRVLSAEALVRWPHPERGILPPGEFLPVAERGDLLRELDRWVLRTALREASTWPEHSGHPVCVAVNLSGLVPGDADFVDVIATSVVASGIPWDRVIIELVETLLIDLPERSRTAMDELVERGVRFAVDDFGTGYSSLARLKELPAQIIKVDRRFVSGVATESADFAVARALVDMGRAMGRSCVAEGVETATQFHVLRGIGVEAFQGWLMSRPIPPGQFRQLLRKGPVHIPEGS